MPEHRELQPQQRKALRKQQQTVSMQTGSGEVELAADQMSLDALVRLVYLAGEDE